MRVQARHWIEETGNTSRAILSIRFSGLLGPLFARLTRNLNDRYLALEAKASGNAARGFKTKFRSSLTLSSVPSG